MHAAFAEYEQAMAEAIPEIVADVKRRGALAAEARTRIMSPTERTATMGNWNVTIQGIGCHHNNAPGDIENLTAKFVEDVKKAGHSVSLAHVTTGGLTDVTPKGDFKERLRAEYAEICGNLGRLGDFLATPTFLALDEAERTRLKTQAEAMTTYQGILYERIKAFA